MEKKYYKLIILSIALIALVLSGIYKEIVVKAENDIRLVDSNEVIELVVHISGEVEKEGVYNLEIGSRVGDLIKLAGGLNLQADSSNINLAEKLKDGQKVFIPKLKTLKESTDSSKSNKNKEVKVKKENMTLEKFNVLSIEQLEEISGVGPVLAKKIYDYRNKNGSFMSVDDLINVSGIGEKKLESIKSHFE